MYLTFDSKQQNVFYFIFFNDENHFSTSIIDVRIARLRRRLAENLARETMGDVRRRSQNGDQEMFDGQEADYQPDGQITFT